MLLDSDSGKENNKRTFESALGPCIDLLRLSNFLDEILNNNSIIHPNITLWSLFVSTNIIRGPKQGGPPWRELDVVVGGNDVHFNLAIRGRRELT
jgi:hypothetical protein